MIFSLKLLFLGTKKNARGNNFDFAKTHKAIVFLNFSESQSENYAQAKHFVKFLQKEIPEIHIFSCNSKDNENDFLGFNAENFDYLGNLKNAGVNETLSSEYDVLFFLSDTLSSNITQFFVKKTNAHHRILISNRNLPNFDITFHNSENWNLDTAARILSGNFSLSKLKKNKNEQHEFENAAK